MFELSKKAFKFGDIMTERNLLKFAFLMIDARISLSYWSHELPILFLEKALIMESYLVFLLITSLRSLHL